MAFVAINSITCRSEYVDRFKDLFQTRARAIDRVAGFLDMAVLEPTREGEPFLVVSRWDSEDAFKAWTTSEEFLEGHKRAFEDLRLARERGEAPPMHSSFSTYRIVAT